MIDTRKVNAVTTTCPDTNNELAAAVDDALLSTAVRSDGSTALGQTIAETPHVLGLRTQRILSALDPSWVRAVRRETIGRRRLAKGSYGIGVGYLGLYDIGVSGMAAAYEHVNAIARGIKQLGDDRTLDQLRADTAVDLLTGGSSPFQSTGPATAKPPTAEPTAAKPAGSRGNRVPERERLDENTTSTASDPNVDVTTAESDVDVDIATTPKPERLDENASTAGLDAATEVRGDHGGRSHATPVPRARTDVDLIVHINMLADLAEAVRRGVVVEVRGFGLVPAEVAARLVKAAAARPSVWCLPVIGDDGRVIEHVRTLHDPTKAMREFVNARDRHCRFPGCLVTAVRCDTDHTPWPTTRAARRAHATWHHPAVDTTG